MKKIASLGVHDHCLRKTHLDGLVVLTKFEGPIQTLITDIKYSYYFDEMHVLSVLLGRYLVQTAMVEKVRPRCLVPVPLHKEKLFERGFNQSELLARELSKLLTIPITDKLLVKTKTTVSQAGLGRKERLKNVDNAFHVTISLKKSDTIVLIDDVVTTGSTLSACAKALKKAGAGKVYGVTLAHGH